MGSENCKKCGKIFYHTSGYPLCAECKVIDDENYKVVREFVRLNPGVKIEEVVAKMKMPYNQVLRYLREEKLEISTSHDDER